MQQRQYNVTLAGRAWSAAEGLERHDELPTRPELIDGRLYATEDERLAMLAALLEQCGAAAAVRIGDPAVWRQAVRTIGSDRRQAADSASEPVMGREVLARMPFGDDPTLGEIMPAPLPNPGLPKVLGATLRGLDCNEESKD